MSVEMAKIKTLWLDVGGVLLSNGWDHQLRSQAAREFHLDANELEERHLMVFDDYEKGKLTLDDYLNHVIFYCSRPFSCNDIKKFIFDESRANQQMIDFIKYLRKKYQLKIALLSNEGSELAQYRLEKFNLYSFVDYYIVSSFVKMRKPELRIFQLAFGLCQTTANEILYIDDRAQHIAIACSLGIHTLKHTDFEATKKFLID